jgi:hypothetical protein
VLSRPRTPPDDVADPVGEPAVSGRSVAVGVAENDSVGEPEGVVSWALLANPSAPQPASAPTITAVPAMTADRRATDFSDVLMCPPSQSIPPRQSPRRGPDCQYGRVHAGRRVRVVTCG